jgi:Ca2+:H+ antiporter
MMWKDPFVYLLVLVPVSLGLAYVFAAPPVWLFVTGVAAIVPLAEWIRRSTEHLAAKLGSTIGGLLNVSFGNAAELILALFVLASGAQEVVKAQVTGSIVGNALLGLGLAALIGGWGREKQTFSTEQSGRLSSLLILSVIALMLPALFDYTERGIFAEPNPGLLDERLSLGVSVVLMAVYVINLVYSLAKKRDTFKLENGKREKGEDEQAEGDEGASGGWPLWQSLAVLLAATAVTALEAKQVSDALEQTSDALGLSTFFLGVVVLAVVGNAAEYLSAVYFARKDRMGLVMGITVGSTIQVALLLAPLLVIFSFFMRKPMNLVFSNPLELIAIAGAALTVNSIAHDGESTWFEGVMLVAVYLLLALAFLFATPG